MNWAFSGGRLSGLGRAACVCSLIAAAAWAQTLPDLPALSLKDFSPEIRAQVQQAAEEARANPRDAEASGRLGMTLQAYEQFESAAVSYERARRLAPDEFRWVYYLGVVQASLGRHAEAAETLREALRRRPDYPPGQLRLADSLFASRQWRESELLYEAVARRLPRSALAHYGLGRVKAARGEPALAAGHFRQAVNLFEHYGAAHYALGLAYRDLGQTAEAGEHLALSQQYKSVGPPAEDALLDAVAGLKADAAELVKKGMSLEAAGQLERAAAEHERALEVNSQFVQAHVNLIILYGRLGQAEKAEQHYRMAAALNPGLAESHYNYGVLLAEQGKYAEAARAFARSLEINPYFADAHDNFGAMIEREGRLEEAAAHYRAAIENQPRHRPAHFRLGRILVHQGKLAEAISHFLQTLMPEDESTPKYMYALAAAYARAGDRDRAVQYARGARERAAARKQTELLAIIERDLRVLEQGK